MSLVLVIQGDFGPLSIHKLYVERRQGHRLAQQKYKVFNQMIRELVRISQKRWWHEATYRETSTFKNCR